MNTNLQNLLDELIENNETPLEELKEIEPILRNNCYKCVEQFYRYYLASIASIVAWFMLEGAVIDKVKLMDMEITNRNILLIAIPFISAILVYRANSLFAFYQFADAALKLIYSKIFPNLGPSTVVYFLEFPSFMTLQNIKADLTDESFGSMMGLLILVFVVNILPILLVGWMAVKLTLMFWWGWYLIFPAMLYIFTIKLIFDLIYFLKNA